MESAIPIIIVSLLFCAFAAGMEMAFVNANRLKVELDRTKDSITGRLLGLFYRGESHFIATLLLANNLGLALYGIYTAEQLEPVIRNWGIHNEATVLILQTLISTLIILCVAEFLPKAVIQLNPNGFLRLGLFPMFLLYLLLYIPTKVIVLLSQGLLRIFGVRTEESEKVFNKTDLQHFVADLNERMEEEAEMGNEMQILQNALDFSNIRARDCMIPRTEIVAIDLEMPIEEVLNTFVETHLSKLLVYRDSVDNIIGYIHSYEMFRKPSGIKQLLRPISFVPSAMAGKELLEMFTKQSTSIAVVVDEYGGTAGIVTIEDVIEEIFGEIEDEHDDEEWIEEKVSEGIFRFSGRAEIDHINRTFGLSLPESENYDTLGGLIIHQLETIPEAGAIVEIDSYTLHIEQVTDRKIELVRLEK